jgi:hypothetical protein
MSEMMTRRSLIARSAAALSALAVPGLAGAKPAGTPMVVYKDPYCGCCKSWVEIMRKAGFEVSSRDTPDMGAIKRRYKVTPALASCHTALVSGYVVEGHVPADLIQKLIREKPKAIGLAVPGMPTGSPGMEGSPNEAYDGLLVDAAGKPTVYARR